MHFYVPLQVMGLSSPGKAEIVSLDSGNIDDILSKSSEFSSQLFRFAYRKLDYGTKPAGKMARLNC